MAMMEPYQISPQEYQAITDHAWEGDTCPQCADILQHIQQTEAGQPYIYPNDTQAEHMADIFGYSADVAKTPAGYLDPSDPNWQRSVEHIQERFKQPDTIGTFGPQSGMMRGEPTRDEWQVTSYLDSLGVSYVHKQKLNELDPTLGRPRIEYDIYIPEYHMAVETSPGWHIGGKSAESFPDVIENDKFKAEFAKEHGIDLVDFDPEKGTEKFINDVLAPRLRAVGVDAYDVPMPNEKKRKEDVFSEHEWNSPLGGVPAYQEEGGDAQGQDYIMAYQIVGHIAQGVESFESWDEFMNDLQFLADTDQMALLQPPNISEEQFQELKPIIDGFMREQTRWPDLKEEEDIKTFRCEYCHELIDPIEEYHEHEGKKYYSHRRAATFDQSQNLQLFPDRGKVNTTVQDFGGPELDFPNHLFSEQEEAQGHSRTICPNCGKPHQCGMNTNCYLQEGVWHHVCRQCGTDFVPEDEAEKPSQFPYQEEDRYECNCPNCECHKPLADPGKCASCAFGEHQAEPRTSFKKRKEDNFNGGAEGGFIGDFYPDNPNRDAGTGEVSPMQTNYGYNEEEQQPKTSKSGYFLCEHDNLIGACPECDEKARKGEEENEIAQIADEYNEKYGLEKVKPVKSISLDEELGMEIAEEYENKEHDPEDPEVQDAYAAFKTEILTQYDFVKEQGFKFDFSEKDPYKGADGEVDFEEMSRDAIENHHLDVFTGGEPLPNDHPLAEEAEDGQNYNNLFRGIHDLFGHIAHDNPITFPGEFGAFLSHMQMFTPEARPAMAWETLANTQWYQYMSEGDEDFAPQKANIFTDIPDEWLLQDVKAQKEEEYPTTDQRTERGNPFSTSPMLFRHVG